MAQFEPRLLLALGNDRQLDPARVHARALPGGGEAGGRLTGENGAAGVALDREGAATAQIAGYRREWRLSRSRADAEGIVQELLCDFVAKIADIAVGDETSWLFWKDAGDPATIEEFVPVINSARFHIVLVLDSRVRGWAGNQFWDSTKAPLTVSGLSADEQERLVADAAALAGVRPGMVEGRHVLTKLHWIAVCSSAAVLGREALDLTNLFGDKARAFAVSAATTLLGMRANARHLRELVGDENEIAHLRELTVVEANAILDAVSVDDRRTAQAANTNALVHYLRWLPDPIAKN